MTTLWLCLMAAWAQDPAYERTAAVGEDLDKPETDLSAELGFTQTSGNSFVIAVNGAVRFAHKWDLNRFRAEVGTNLNVVRVDTDGDGTVSDDPDADFEWTSQRAAGFLRYDRFFGERNALYVSFGGEHDRPAGLIWRFNEQIGYSRILVATERTKLSFEIGASYNEENFVQVTDDDGNVLFDGVLDAHYLAARAFLGFSHAFNDIVSITESIELIEPLLAVREGEDGLTNFEDFRLVNEISLTTKLSDRFSLKVSDRLMFDNQPPTPDYAKVDNVVMVTLVATIL